MTIHTFHITIYFPACSMAYKHNLHGVHFPEHTGTSLFTVIIILITKTHLFQSHGKKGLCFTQFITNNTLISLCLFWPWPYAEIFRWHLTMQSFKCSLYLASHEGLLEPQKVCARVKHWHGSRWSENKELRPSSPVSHSLDCSNVHSIIRPGAEKPTFTQRACYLLTWVLDLHSGKWLKDIIC